jgi:hypothetical protein
MNTNTLRNRSKRLLEVNAVIKELDPAVRLAAFTLLEDYVTTGESSPEKEREITVNRDGEQNREAFFSKFETDKPADNAHLLAGYLYSQYGSAQFSIDEIKALATEVGLIVPDRVDMTIRNSQREGKHLFQATGRGMFRPTVHGELFFKSAYRVSKGTQVKAST